MIEIMRSKRTSEEQRVLDRIKTPLNRLGILKYEIDETVTDAPDIVLKTEFMKIGLEVTQLNYEDFCKWSKYIPGKEYERGAKVTMNLEKLLANVAKKKWINYEKYKINFNLDECWLVLHNDLFEMEEGVNADRISVKWFEVFSRLTLQDLKCPYDRVWFNPSHVDRWYQMFNKKHYIKRSKSVLDWPVIVFKERSFIMKRGENIIDLSHISSDNSFN